MDLSLLTKTSEYDTARSKNTLKPARLWRGGLHSISQRGGVNGTVAAVEPSKLRRRKPGQYTITLSTREVFLRTRTTQNRFHIRDISTCKHTCDLPRGGQSLQVVERRQVESKSSSNRPGVRMTWQAPVSSYSASGMLPLHYNTGACHMVSSLSDSVPKSQKANTINSLRHIPTSSAQLYSLKIAA